MPDLDIGRHALSSVVSDPRTLLQGTFCVLALALIAAGVTVGERRVLGVGAWAAAVGLCYAVAIRMVARAPRRGAWRVPPEARRERGESPEQEAGADGASLRRLVLGTAGTAAIILMAGYALARPGETIAERSGLGTSFVGAVLVAFATSLPAVSTVVAAARLRRYEMAVSEVFGTNLADAALVLLVDAIASGPPVLGQLGAFSVFAALLGIVLTTLYVGGLLERDDRAVLRMGVDSLAVLIAYGIGVVVLYHLR